MPGFLRFSLASARLEKLDSLVARAWGCLWTYGHPVDERVDIPVKGGVESLWLDTGQLSAPRLFGLIPCERYLCPQPHPQEKSSKFRFFNVPTGPTNGF